MGPLKPAPKGSFAVDVICVCGGATLTATEFFVQFASAAFLGDCEEDASVQFYCNEILAEGVQAALAQRASRTVYFRSTVGLSRFATSDVLRCFNLRSGFNSMACGNELLGFVQFSLYLWEFESRVVVVDIDGTLTKSNIRGYVETVFLGTYDYIHVGVVLFLLFLDKLGLQILYLTARPRSHIDETRNLLRNMTENGVNLPAGPLFTHRGGRMTTLYMELISESTASFKHSVLLEVAELYRNVALTKSVKYSYKCPFFLGVGNKDTDATAYYSAGISITNILIMQRSGEVIAGGFIPQPSDYVAHQSSRAPINVALGPDDEEATAAVVCSIKTVSALTKVAFSSYGDPRLLSYTKDLILSSSKVVSFGGYVHEENEGKATDGIILAIIIHNL